MSKPLSDSEATSTGAETARGRETVRLELPAVGRHVRLARLTAASLAADAGFDLDDIEDMRVAVNEAFAIVVDDHDDPDSTVTLTFHLDGETITVNGARTFADEAPELAADDLTVMMLEVIVDHHRFAQDGRRRSFELRKRATRL